MSNKPKDTSFVFNASLYRAVDLLSESFTEMHLQQTPGINNKTNFSATLPKQGVGENVALNTLAPFILGQAAPLDSAHASAHMDPPTPWITWATSMFNARLNQNLLHPATAPFARQAEQIVIDWLSPYFGMQGGHFCAGSTIANLTALWAARDAKGITKVVASEAAHISVAKAAKILGLSYQSIAVCANGTINKDALGDLSSACLVLTAGTTATGAVDDLSIASAANAAWVHVDAAWAGPLRLSHEHAHLLAGIEAADSVAISAHKWLFQPKESALVLFKHLEIANVAISVGSDYLVAPNIGLQGSRGAAAVSLLATILAWGEEGFAQRINANMDMANQLANFVELHSQFILWQRPTTGLTIFAHKTMSVDELLTLLPTGMFSRCQIDNKDYVRSVAANPNADIASILDSLRRISI
jgi:L-2,4-diaminobutyrate decarboxylase